MADQDPSYKAGMQIRRDMFGAAGAEERVAAATDFNRPFEDFVTRYCFGDTWSRPGLDRRTRSMITLAALTALVRPNQLKNHVRGALANGVTPEEIREILLLVALYCGIPAANEAHRAAMDVLAEEKK